MKAFVDWVLASRLRVIAIAAATAIAPMLQIVAMALMALEAMRRGLNEAITAALIGTVIVAALAFVAGANVGALATAGGLSLGAGVGLGALVRSGGGLAPAFRGVVLFSAAGVIVLSLFGSGAEHLLRPLFELIVEMLRERGAGDEQIEAFRAAEPLVLGLLAAGVLTQLLAALFLAYWWRGLAVNDSRFGREFRRLSLSPALGFPASILVVVGLVLDAPVIQNLAPLALFGFLFQGLAVLHAWAHSKRWHAVYVLPVYALLITPLVGFVVLALSAVGLVDNWFDLRAPLRSGT